MLLHAVRTRLRAVTSSLNVTMPKPSSATATHSAIHDPMDVPRNAGSDTIRPAVCAIIRHPCREKAAMPEGPEVDLDKLRETIDEEIEKEGSALLRTVALTTALFAALAAI